MTELHLRNIPADLHERLQERARAEGRSMSAEAVVLLRSALDGRTDLGRRRVAVGRLAEIRQRTVVPPGAPVAEELVREDRDAR